VRPRHLIELVRRLRAPEYGLAPKSVLNVYGVVRTLFRDAFIAELVMSSPAVLTRRHLPRAEDKDPAWRATAIFTRPELETVISDERVPFDRRVFYALEGVAGAAARRGCRLAVGAVLRQNARATGMWARVAGRGQEPRWRCAQQATIAVMRLAVVAAGRGSRARGRRAIGEPIGSSEAGREQGAP
jgi:hypothetical protein